MSDPLYDDPEFHERYKQFPRQQRGLAGAPEWPTIEALIPNVRDASFLDLGCGFGWHSRWAAEQGARRVLGIDASQRMLDEAAATTSTAAVEYQVGDLETIEFAETFDVTFSSLALHYVADIDRLFRSVRAATRPGGSFVFSVEHPLMTGPTRLEAIEVEGEAAWPVDRYCDEGPRTRTWLVDDVIKQHRTVGTWINALVDADYAISRVLEWTPTAADVAENPAWSIDRVRPPFLIIAATAT